jgi:hypothetical protein
VQFSPCGKFLATCHAEHVLVRVLDSGETRQLMISHARGVVFSPCGGAIIVKTVAGMVVAASLVGSWEGFRVLLANTDSGPLPVFVDRGCFVDGDWEGVIRIVGMDGAARIVSQCPGEMIKSIMPCGASAVLVTHGRKWSESQPQEQPVYFTMWRLPFGHGSPRLIQTRLVAVTACACSMDGSLVAVATTGTDPRIFVLRLESECILANVAIAADDRFVKHLRWVGNRLIAVVSGRVIAFDADLVRVGSFDLPLAMSVDVSTDRHWIAVASSREGLLASGGSVFGWML